MKVKWIIEDKCFPEDTQPLLDALAQLGIEYHLVQHDFSDFGEAEDCVVFYGSLPLAKRIRKKARWIPGVYYDVPKYNCTAYYAALGKYLLNGNYIFLPFAELKRQKEFLYESVGEDRTIFIRPNRGDKIFTGKMIYKEHYDKEIEQLGYGQIEPDELVVVSEPRNLVREWRFLVIEGKVVTGSQYKENDRVAYEVGYSQEAYDLASEIAHHYNPDLAWVIDICQTKVGNYYLLELGAFSCAGLYKCDRAVVAQGVSTVALREWQSYQLD